MSKLNYIITTENLPIPSGVTPGKGYRLTLTDVASGAVVTQDVADLSGAFDISAGTYSGTCQALDVNSSPFGNIAESSVTVPVDTYAAPATLTFSV